jgi:hypothetical protein
MRRFSVRTLMILIVGAAVGLAALRNADDFWAPATATVVVVAIATSVMGALTLRGRERYTWAGFAVFSSIYLVAAVATESFASFVSFGPTAALEYVQSHAVGDQTDRWRSWLPGALNTNEFRCVGHSLFALLSGLIGCVVGRLFYARRERNEIQTH